MKTADGLNVLLGTCTDETPARLVTIEIGSASAIADLRENLAGVSPLSVVSEPDQVADERLVFVDWPKMTPSEQATFLQRVFDTDEFRGKVVTFPLYRVKPVSKMSDSRNLSGWFLCRTTNIVADF